MAKGPGKYVVEFTMVGVHTAGDVVEFTKNIIEEGGHDVERLLKLGAIRPATDEEAKKSVEYGANADATPLFPPVPADPNAAAHQEVPQKPAPEEKK